MGRQNVVTSAKDENKMSATFAREVMPPHAPEYIVWTMTRSRPSSGDGYAVGKRLAQGQVKESLWCSFYL